MMHFESKPSGLAAPVDRLDYENCEESREDEEVELERSLGDEDSESDPSEFVVIDSHNTTSTLSKSSRSNSNDSCKSNDTSFKIKNSVSTNLNDRGAKREHQDRRKEESFVALWNDFATLGSSLRKSRYQHKVSSLASSSSKHQRKKYASSADCIEKLRIKNGENTLFSLNNNNIQDGQAANKQKSCDTDIGLMEKRSGYRKNHGFQSLTISHYRPEQRSSISSNSSSNSNNSYYIGSVASVSSSSRRSSLLRTRKISSTSYSPRRGRKCKLLKLESNVKRDKVSVVDGVVSDNIDNDVISVASLSDVVEVDTDAVLVEASSSKSASSFSTSLSNVADSDQRMSEEEFTFDTRDLELDTAAVEICFSQLGVLASPRELDKEDQSTNSDDINSLADDASLDAAAAAATVAVEMTDVYEEGKCGKGHNGQGDRDCSDGHGGVDPHPLAASRESNTPQTVLVGSSSQLELHRDVFENNLEKLDYWRKSKRRLNSALECFDSFGLNALHLACRLGRLEYLDLFLVLANTHYFKSRTKDAPHSLGWTVLDEAVILGNRKYIKLVYLMLQYHQQKRLKEREVLIRGSLLNTMDFTLTIKWMFRSWIPLLSRYLPSDTCVLYKKGSCVRLDSTLLNFAQNTWKRGKITVLYNPTVYGGENFVFVVDAQKQYSVSSIDKPLKPSELSREVNSLLSNDVIVTKVSTKNMHYTPIKRFISRNKKVDNVGKYSASFYHWSGMLLKIYKRRDHLSVEQISKNKNVLNDFYTGGVMPGMSTDGTSGSSSGGGGGRSTRVADLKPPQEPKGTFEDYILGKTTAGRTLKIKAQTKHFKGCLAMSEQFPLTVEKLCEILELFSNFRLFSKLRNFLQRGLPPGFPVYIEMPVFPTVQGQITMEDFQTDLPIEAQHDTFYLVPSHYEQVEDLEVN